MNFVNRLDRAFIYGLGAICVVLFVVMLTAVFGQVIMRYVFSRPLSWSEELARYAMVWQAMLASALCSRLGQHLALVSADMLPKRLGAVLHYVTTAVICAILLVLLWHGYDLASRASRQTTPGLGLSMSVIYACLPVGFALMIVGQLLGLVAGRGGDAAPPPQTGPATLASEI